MRARVYVTLKQGVLDPQGKAVERSLHSLGYTGVADVRMGKYVEFELGSVTPDTAASQVREICEKLLSNPVIEDFRFELQPS